MQLSKLLRAVDHPYITGKGGRKENNGKSSMQVGPFCLHPPEPRSTVQNYYGTYHQGPEFLPKISQDPD